MILPNGPETDGDLCIATRASLLRRGYVFPSAHQYLVHFIDVDGNAQEMFVPSYERLVNFCSIYEPTTVRLDTAPGENVENLLDLFDFDLTVQGEQPALH